MTNILLVVVLVNNNNTGNSGHTENCMNEDIVI